MENNKIYKSILIKEIENKIFNSNKGTKLFSFWKVNKGNNADEVYSIFSSFIRTIEFCNKISELSEIEADILELLFNSDGSATRIQIVSSFEKKYSIDLLQQNTTELVSKFLIYERRNLNNLAKNSFKYIIYDEVFESLKLWNFCKFSKDLYPKIPQRYYDYIKINNNFTPEIIEESYINNGFIPIEHIKQIKEIEYSKIKLVKFDKIVPLYINDKKVDKDFNKNDDNGLKSSMHYDWVNCIEKLFLYIKRNGLFYTQKGKLKKPDIENLTKICNNNQKLMELLFEILFEMRLININNNEIKINLSFRKFLNKPIEEKFRQIINTRLFSNITLYLKNLVSDNEFSAMDLLREVTKEKQNETTFYKNSKEKQDEFIVILENLYLLGLLEKYNNLNPIGFGFSYMLNKILLRQISKLSLSSYKTESDTDSIIVNRDFSIIIYPEKITDTDRLTIFSFTEEISNAEVIRRRITKNSIQNAIYLGNSLDKFISLLNSISKIKPDEHLIQYCYDWEKGLKKVTMKNVYIIEGDPNTIETIELDPEINIGEVKKAGKEYLIIKDPNKIPHNIGLDNIFVYKEGEDF